MKIWKPLKRIFSIARSKKDNGDDLIGQIARSVSGRDIGTLYVITGHENGVYVTVCDGERRKTSGPKKKNVRHLMMTGQRVPDEYVVKGALTASDEQISSFLSGLDRI